MFLKHVGGSSTGVTIIYNTSMAIVVSENAGEACGQSK